MKKFLLTTFIFCAGLLASCTKDDPQPTKILTVNPAEITFPAMGGDATFEITSNTDWEIVGASDKFAISSTSGNGNATITVTATSNETSIINSATLTIKTLTDDLSETVTLTQAGLSEDNFILILTDGATAEAKFTAIGVEAVAAIKNLIVVGAPTDADFETIRTAMKTTLESIDLSNAAITAIPDDALEEMSALKSVVFPAGLTTIGDYTFYESGLTSVVIPSSVTSFGGYAFAYCEKLTSVTLPEGLTTIVENAFSWSGLTSITIPSSVTSFGDHAFSGCADLTSVTLPEGLTTIGYGAFQNSGLTSVVIPSSVTSFGNHAFYECAELTNVTLAKGFDDSTWRIPRLRFNQRHNSSNCYFDRRLCIFRVRKVNQHHSH